jgi:hypothetical protein
MKSKWESPTTQKLICAFGDSHLCITRRKGWWSLCSYACRELAAREGILDPPNKGGTVRLGLLAAFV